MSEADAALRRALDFVRAGNAAEAERVCRAAQTRAPHDARLLALLGNLLAARGALGEAALAVAAALHADPEHVPALAEDAALALRRGDARHALAQLDRVLARVPPSAALLYQIAQAAHALGDVVRMRAALQRAQVLDPGEPGTGLVLLRLDAHARRIAEVEQTAQALLRRQPGLIDAWRLLGETRLAVGRAADAAQALGEATRLAPNDVPLHEALARAPDSAGGDPALRCAARERIVALAPTAHHECELGLALWQCNRFDHANDAFRRAVQLDPAYLPARLATFQYPRDVVFADATAVDGFRTAWLQGLAALETQVASGVGAPADALAAATLCTNFTFHYTTDDVRPAQQRYARVIERLVRASVAEHAIVESPAADGRVRVAVFSAHLFAHTMTRLFGSLLRGLDRRKVRLAIFHHGDEATIRAELAQGDDLVVSGARGVADWASAIRAFAPRVLVHTDLGMQPLAQCLASLRLAPTQAVLWGHPVTTGFEHIDVFLSSAAMELDDAASRYSERLVTLPGLGTCFAPPRRAPRTPPELAERDPARVEYLFLQSVFKNLPLHDALLARIAAALPAARFHLTPHADPAISARLRERLARAFEREGLDPGRHLGIVRGLPPAEFLGLARAGEVNLDSVGWSGGNTTLEALWFDLPTVTLPGRSLRTRHTAAMLELLGLERLVANDIDDYLNISIELGRSADLRAEIRGLIAARKHRLYDDRAVVAAFEAFCLEPPGQGRAPDARFAGG